MERFCGDVLEFLTSEYGDAYAFYIELTHLSPGSREATLKIKSGNFTRSISGSYMNYICKLYYGGEFSHERKQWLWQKELIDLIEWS